MAQASHGRRPGAQLRVTELEPRETPSVSVRFDYSLDSTGFFNDPARRAAVQTAADAITSYLQDDLAAIVPSGTNTWKATVFNPGTNSTVTLTNPTVHEDELIVFLGAAPIGVGELGLATTGGFTASGSRSWLDTVRSRGQFGTLTSPKTDFASWGGMITFDADSNWYAGTGTPAGNQFDLSSVALHELMHVFGFGLGEAAFTRNIVNGKFAGPNVVAAFGSPVPVSGDSGIPDHWAQSVRVSGAESPMLPALGAGVKRHMTAIDYAALADLGWEVSSPAVVSPPPATQVSPAPTQPAQIISPPSSTSVGRRFAIGTQAGAALTTSAGVAVTTTEPTPGMTGSARVATADVTGDGTPDLITGTAPGVGNRVTVFDGRTGAVLGSFQAFEPSFAGGVFVAAGDFTGDGRPDIVVTPDRTGGPVVAVFDGEAAGRGAAAQVARFFGIADTSFRGGARPAVGDVNGDGQADLAVAAGFGGGPRIGVIDGRSVRTVTPTQLLPDFFAFESGLRNGTFVAVADLDGDGKAEIIAGAGPGGAPRVSAFAGRDLLAGGTRLVADFFAGAPDSRGGVRVAAADIDGDGRADIVTGAGDGGAVVQAYSLGQLLRGSSSPILAFTTAGGADGVYVG